MPQSLLLLLSFSHFCCCCFVFAWINAPYIARSLWFIFRVLKMLILTIFLSVLLIVVMQRKTFECSHFSKTLKRQKTLPTWDFAAIQNILVIPSHVTITIMKNSQRSKAQVFMPLVTAGGVSNSSYQKVEIPWWLYITMCNDVIACILERVKNLGFL